MSWHYALLPGDLQGGGRRSARDWAVDVVMWLIAVGVSAAVFADAADTYGPGMALLDALVGVVALVALGWRRSRPGEVGVLVTAAAIASSWAAGPATIALFNVAVRGTRRALLAVMGLSAVSAFVFPLIHPPGDSYLLNLFLGALILAVVTSWGLLVRVRREQLLALRDRAARHAREVERRRIAGEMHDVLAHRMTLLSVHAGALEFRADAAPEEIAHAAGVIRATARAALEDLRAVIGVLREDADGAPQPTLADIPALVEESRAAGMRVDFHSAIASDPRPTVGRTAYRVVQEGLTNARKHAPGAPVEVTLSGCEQLVVEVVTREPVAVGTTPLPGAGTGLIGLDERVTLAGGALQHGPDAAGRFVLRATLPWAL